MATENMIEEEPIKKSSRKYWFRSKYGFGWYPVTWKGFFIFLLYFAFLIFMYTRISSNSDSISSTLIGFAPFAFCATIILLFICYIMGEQIKIKKLKI